MRICNNGLDEMQKERRNSVGNQMFMLMFFALLIDSGLYGAGVRWLDYPANVMVIISTCISIYLIRLIALSAYHPPKTRLPQRQESLKFLDLALWRSEWTPDFLINLDGRG